MSTLVSQGSLFKRDGGLYNWVRYLKAFNVKISLLRTKCKASPLASNLPPWFLFSKPALVIRVGSAWLSPYRSDTVSVIVQVSVTSLILHVFRRRSWSTALGLLCLVLLHSQSPQWALWVINMFALAPLLLSLNQKCLSIGCLVGRNVTCHVAFSQGVFFFNTKCRVVLVLWTCYHCHFCTGIFFIDTGS